MPRPIDILEPTTNPEIISVTRYARNHMVSPGRLDTLPVSLTDEDRGAFGVVLGGVGEDDAVYWIRRTAAGVIETVHLPQNTQTDALVFILNGNGSPLATGVAGDLDIPYACTITSVRALADQVGSLVVAVWRDTYANYPPTGGDVISASAPITISSDDQSQDLTLTGWSTALAAGDTLRFSVTSCSTITRCTLSLRVSRTL